VTPHLPPSPPAAAPSPEPIQTTVQITLKHARRMALDAWNLNSVWLPRVQHRLRQEPRLRPSDQRLLDRIDRLMRQRRLEELP
jgi:hypothetical protein